MERAERCSFEIEYLRRCRLLRAAELLRTTQAPVTDIALGCGFATPSYFAGKFKKLMGKRLSSIGKTPSVTTPGPCRMNQCEKAGIPPGLSRV